MTDKVVVMPVLRFSIFFIAVLVSCHAYPEIDGEIDWERISRPGMDDVFVYDSQE